MRDLQRVTVFCGSSSGADPAFADAARSLGAALAGVNAGIYPDVSTRDVSHDGLTDLRHVAAVHKRKRLMGFLHHAVDQGLPKPDHLASISLTTPGEAIDHRRSFRFTDGQKWS